MDIRAAREIQRVVRDLLAPLRLSFWSQVVGFVQKEVHAPPYLFDFPVCVRLLAVLVRQIDLLT